MTMLHIDPQPPSTTASVDTPVAFGMADPTTANDDWQALRRLRFGGATPAISSSPRSWARSLPPSGSALNAP